MDAIQQIVALEEVVNTMSEGELRAFCHAHYSDEETDYRSWQFDHARGREVEFLQEMVVFHVTEDNPPAPVLIDFLWKNRSQHAFVSMLAGKRGGSL